VKLELRITRQEIPRLKFKGTNAVDYGKGAYGLDVIKSPPVLRAAKIKPRGRKEEYLGICSPEGDTLKWCISPRKARPTELPTGDGCFLLILKNDTGADLNLTDLRQGHARSGTAHRAEVGAAARPNSIAPRSGVAPA
jgi:hypothetical protein